MTPVKEISERLAQRALSLCEKLIPGGDVKGDFYVCAGTSGGEGESLKVHLSGSHIGKWKDWATSADHGDMLDLWRIARGLSPGAALQEAKSLLGIADPAASQPKKYAKPAKREDPSLDPTGKAFNWLVGTRLINAETLKRFRISVWAERKMITFPCFSPTGNLLNRSYRSLPKEGEKKKVEQDAGCPPSLFGWQALPSCALEQKIILLSEGQVDAMTWDQWGIPALSIPNGSGQTWIDYEWNNLAYFDRVYLAFDMDEEGQDMTDKAVPRLGAHRCYLVKMPHKDANECLQKGCTAADARGWVDSATLPKVKALIRPIDIKDRIMREFQVQPKAFTLPVFDKGWPHTGLYFRPGEVTLWTGHSHHGKSTFINYLIVAILSWHLMKADRIQQSVFVGSMEVRIETTFRRLVTTILDEMRSPMDEESILFILEKYGTSIVFADVVGYIEQDRLFEMMRFSFQRYGVQHFFIDSLMRIDGLEENYPEQGRFVGRLEEFVKETGIHVHLVAHPRKNGGGKPGMEDVKGSSLIANGVDNVVAVCRNMEKADLSKERELTDDEANDYDTEIRVEKQKESGWMGSFFYRFNRQTYNFKPCQKRIKPKEEKPRYEKKPRSRFQY